MVCRSWEMGNEGRSFAVWTLLQRPYAGVSAQHERPFSLCSERQR